MGRKSGYTPEIAKVICEAIAHHGGMESGWKAGKISYQTFYRWQKEYSEFREMVARAAQEFTEKCGDEMKFDALERLRDALKNGQKIQWETVSERVLEKYSSDGTLLGFHKEVVKSQHTEHRPTPQWAIERVIPKPVWSVEQLSAIASEYGLQLVVKDFDLFKKYLSAIEPENEDNRNSISGLSEEAANEIRRQILGLEE